MEQSIKPEREIWFQKDIKEMLKQDASAPPSQGAVLFLGSSIVRFWATLARDMSPLQVVNRAFGGARTWEVLHYMDRIVLPCKPAVIAYYCGSNDIEYGSRAEGHSHAFPAILRAGACLIARNAHIFYLH